MCVVVGLVWSVLFPKTADMLQPDFVASVAIGLGLVLTGVILLFATKARAAASALAIVLAWSLLLNVFLFSQVHAESTLIRHMAAQQENPKH